MIGSPLETPIAFHLGPVPIATPVLVTWGIMILLAGGSWMLTRRLELMPGRVQAVLELVVEAIDSQIRETMRVEPARFRALIGTLLVFILTANWSSLVPGIEPPTAHIETDAALAAIVAVSVIVFGIQAQGLGGYLKTFAEPSLVMVPLNLVEQITRTFSLVIRLFGNVMSGVFVIGIVLSLAGLLVPIPLMALDLLTGAVQAYIFAVLAMVFIASGLEGEGGSPPAPGHTSTASSSPTSSGTES
ncbi:F0F1 ATP synthase subunit A [uncultured Tistrella sp.]|uniref:F0F1 ATP synthase subunit A n=1 Tax=Tistrella mobilis TaxID=171437 RepID=UPI000C0B2E5B|nr:F0F1 ATP synthase subunit A [uncultured Tistrella sp.]MAM74082.1 ATP synthase F0 subunit A [Tistrella sp.]